MTMRSEGVKLLVTVFLCGVLSTCACATSRASYSEFCEATASFGPLRGRATTLVVGGTAIGFLSYVKFPCLSWYVMFDFYVSKDFRGRGYGRYLLGHVRDELSTRGATKIFIQPGPFELERGVCVCVNGAEGAAKTARLVCLYHSLGFRPVNICVVTFVLRLLYALLSIAADPRFLMAYG